MSKKGPDQVTKTSTTIDPFAQQKWNQAWGTMNEAAGQMRGWTGDQKVAGMDPAEMQAYQGIQNVVANRQGQGMVQDGSQAILNMMRNIPGGNLTQANAAQAGINPYLQNLMGEDGGLTIEAARARAAQAQGPDRGTIRDVSSTTGAAGMAAYQNPYEDQVVQGVVSDLDRARQMLGNQADAQAAASGAFGGSRAALVQTENNRNFLDQVGRSTGQLRARGFETAAGLGQTDAARALQAAGMNQGADTNFMAQQQATRMANAQMGTQANIANAGFATQANMANAGNQLALAGMGQQATQFDAGLMQQANMQNANAANNMSQFNAGQRLQGTLAGGQALANMGMMQHNMDLSGLNGLAQMGGLSRGIEQGRRDFDYGNLASIAGMQAGILQGMPVGQNSVSRTPTQKSPMAGMAGGAMAGLATGNPWGVAAGAGIGLLGSYFG